MGMLFSNLKQQGNPLQGMGQNRVGMDPDGTSKLFSKISMHLFDFSKGKDANSNEVSAFGGTKSSFFMKPGNKKQAWENGL